VTRGDSGGPGAGAEHGRVRVVSGRERLPPQVLRNIQRAVAIARAQEELLRRGEMSPADVDGYEWGADQELPTAGPSDPCSLRVWRRPLRGYRG
jgi:hypothetical protein